jgi:hypothetical protein
MKKEEIERKKLQMGRGSKKPKEEEEERQA